MRFGVRGLLAAAISFALIGAGSAPALGHAGASAQEHAGPQARATPPRASVSLSMVGRDYYEDLQREIVRDRDRAKRGKLRLGALSDGYFDARIRFAQHRVVILMPPLRAKQLPRTRRLVAKRYRGKPVEVYLARRVKPRPWTGPTRRGGAIPARPGKPLFCPPSVAGSPSGDWNAKRIIGQPLARAERMARAHGCAVRVVLIDGMGIGGTADLRYERINVVVRFGKVTRIFGLA